MSSKKRHLYSGILLSLVGVAAFLALGYFSFRLTNHVIDALDLSLKKEKIDYAALKKDFFISFENPQDARMFDAQGSAFAVSEEFAAQGKRSLKIEYPSGREYPGAVLEVYGRHCFDWSRMKEMSFVVSNTMPLPARLHVNIKSGEQYPKKIFETSQTIPAGSIAKFKIKRSEIERELDLKKISSINFYMQDPRTSFIVYLDEIKVTREE